MMIDASAGDPAGRRYVGRRTSRFRRCAPGPIAMALAVAFSTSCTTGEGTVDGSAAAATVVDVGGTRPTVAVSPASGRGYVAWVGIDGDEYNVYLTAAEAGSTSFSPAVRVNDIPGDAAAHDQAPAQVAVGSRGEIYVLWQNNTVVEGRRFPASDLRLAVSTDGGNTFGPAVTVNDDAGELPTSHTFHDLAVADDGMLVVSWIDSREQDRARQATAASGHGMAMGDSDASPAADDSGTANGEAAASVPLGPEIRVARSWDMGLTFTPSIVVDTNACPCCRTALALAPDGTVYLAWRKLFVGDVRDIVVARAGPDQLEFDDPVRVHRDEWVYPGCPHAGPAIRTDADDRLHVGWYTGREDRQGLWYAVSEDAGRSFGPPSPVLVDDWVPPSQVVMTSSGAGMLLGWEDLTSEGGAVWLARAGVGGAGELAGTSVGQGRLPAIDGSGEGALLAWLEGETIRARWLP